MIRGQRQAIAIRNAGLAMNRFDGTGSGSGMVLPSLGFKAGGPQGNYSTANNATYADVTNSTFQLHISRIQNILHMFYCAAHLSAAGALGYIRVNIVGYDVTAGLQFGTTATTNGFLWYGALDAGKGPIIAGEYTAKLQAATDNNGFNITVDQFFHQTLALN